MINFNYYFFVNMQGNMEFNTLEIFSKARECLKLRHVKNSQHIKFRMKPLVQIGIFRKLVN